MDLGYAHLLTPRTRNMCTASQRYVQMVLVEKTPPQDLDIPTDLGPPWAYMSGSTTLTTLK